MPRKTDLRAESAEVPDVAPYAIRVGGRLGPALLSAIPHRAVVAQEDRIVIVTRVMDETDLVEITRALVERGVEIHCVRELTDG